MHKLKRTSLISPDESIILLLIVKQYYLFKCSNLKNKINSRFCNFDTLASNHFQRATRCVLLRRKIELKNTKSHMAVSRLCYELIRIRLSCNENGQNKISVFGCISEMFVQIDQRF